MSGSTKAKSVVGERESEWAGLHLENNESPSTLTDDELEAYNIRKRIAVFM